MKDKGFATLISLIVTVAIICWLAVYVLKVSARHAAVSAPENSSQSLPKNARTIINQVNQQTMERSNSLLNITESAP